MRVLLILVALSGIHCHRYHHNDRKTRELVIDADNIYKREESPSGYQSLGGNCPGHTLKKEVMSTLEKCAHTCSTTANCVGVSWLPAKNNAWSTHNYCFLKSHLCSHPNPNLKAVFYKKNGAHNHGLQNEQNTGNGQEKPGNTEQNTNNEGSHPEEKPAAVKPSESENTKPSSGTFTLKEFRDTALKVINELRAYHCVDPLTPKPDLEQKAQEWAEHEAQVGAPMDTAWKHNYQEVTKELKGTYPSVGQNLGLDGPAMMGDKKSAKEIADNVIKDQWYTSEKKIYEKLNPSYKWRKDQSSINGGVFHFVQVVWKATKHVGFGYSKGRVAADFAPMSGIFPLNPNFNENVLKPCKRRKRNLYKRQLQALTKLRAAMRAIDNEEDEQRSSRSSMEEAKIARSLEVFSKSSEEDQDVVQAMKTERELAEEGDADIAEARRMEKRYERRRAYLREK